MKFDFICIISNLNRIRCSLTLLLLRCIVSQLLTC